jgi:hypothetical protein
MDSHAVRSFERLPFFVSIRLELAVAVPFGPDLQPTIHIFQ